MPSFGSKSLANLSQLHPLLQQICIEAIKEIDFTILDAQRGRAEQELAFRQKRSKARFGQSAHNYVPAVSMDVAPYPIDFDDLDRFKELAKVIMRIARELGIKLRWGGDWNMDGSTSDGWDFPHFELHPWREWAKKSKLYEGK